MTARASAFWDRRYASEGALWGTEASPSAFEAARLFDEGGVRRVLVPGCGYGRHCFHLSQEGFEVVGLDASVTALDMARASAAAQSMSVEFILGDVAEMRLPDADFDAIYERALLHLLVANERAAAVAGYLRVLRPGGLLYVTTFAVDDDECGVGPEVEPGTFDAKGGRPAHFFTEDDLRNQLRSFDIEQLDLVRETEDHGSGRHDHRFWRVVSRRPS
jgi:SAM-dependent methyltransferase